MNEWQPIETAPETGPYLVSDGRYRWICHRRRRDVEVEIENWLGATRYPTHWIFLPDLPPINTQHKEPNE